ncbi:MAG: TRAP transporter small permease [Eubacteriales bacterium]
MKKLDYIEEFLLVLSLSIMVVINFGNVVSRYILHKSWSFSEEIMVYLFVYSTFIGASVAFKRGSHLGVTWLSEKLPEKGRKILLVFSAITTLALMIILLKFGVQMVRNQIMYNQTTPALGMPEWISGISMPIGAVLIGLRVLQNTYIAIKS